MIYLLNFNITYIIILATCFDSYESSSDINFQELLYILSYSFMCQSNYCNRDPFMHYKTRANVYMALGRGVWLVAVVVCAVVRILGGWGGGFVMHKAIPIAIFRLRHKNCKT